MPSERLPAPASPHDTASLISALHERKGDGPPLFSSLSANPDSGHISGGLDLRLPSEGSTVPALPQVAALGLQNSSLLGVASDPLGPPATISLHLPWKEFHALTLSDDTASSHSNSSCFSLGQYYSSPSFALPAREVGALFFFMILWHLNFQRTACWRGLPRPPLRLLHHIVFRGIFSRLSSGCISSCWHRALFIKLFTVLCSGRFSLDRRCFRTAVEDRSDFGPKDDHWRIGRLDRSLPQLTSLL